jgi:hypothetical protein
MFEKKEMYPGKRRYQIFLKSKGAIDVYLVSKDEIETEILSSNNVDPTNGVSTQTAPSDVFSLPSSSPNVPFATLLPQSLSSGTMMNPEEENRMFDYYLSNYPSEYVSDLYLN